MIRVLLFFVLLVLLAFGIVWIVDRPGEIAVTWQGYRIETTVAVALGFVLLGAVLLALLFGLLRFLLRMPTLMARRAERRRRAKGHAALSRGMVAVGAGDAKLARKSSAGLESMVAELDRTQSCTDYLKPARWSRRFAASGKDNRAPRFRQ